MREHTLESGLLPTFRLYIAVRLVFVVIAGAFYLVWYQPPIGPGLLMASVPFVADIVILFVLLRCSCFRHWLGRLYLPVALLVAVVGPIVQVGYVLPAFDTDATFAFLLGFSLLLVPLILTAWQYSFRWVLIFGLSTSLFEFLLLTQRIGLTPERLRWSTVALFGRSLLTIFVGYIVSNLIEEQKRQRRELARANRQLIRYAVTLEQLAVSRERNRLARELHDTLAHGLSGLAVQLDAIAALWEKMPPRARLMLDHALSTTRTGLDETRRALQALRATPLEDMGLSLAIRDLAERTTARVGLGLQLARVDRLGDVSPEVEQCYYRVAQEALENVIRHANATNVSVSLQREGQQLVLQVADNGMGFTAEADRQRDQLGIRGMRERAELIGADLKVRSSEGQGTVVRLTYEEQRDSSADL
jgi:signal transduction histidine kinase